MADDFSDIAEPIQDDFADIAEPSPVSTPKPSRKDSILARFGRVGLQSAMKGAASIPDLALNLPNAVVNLPKAAVGSIANLAGRPDLAPDVNLQPNYAREALFQSGLATPEYEPQTAAERTLGAAIEGGVSTALSGKPSAAMLGLGATASGVGQGVSEVTDSPIAGMAANLLTTAAMPSAAKYGKAKYAKESASAKAAQSLNADRDAAMIKGLDMGLVASPSEAKNRTFTSTLMAGKAGKIATEGEASMRNQPIIHNAMADEIGVAPNTPLKANVLNKVRSDAYKQGYEPLKNIGEIKPDKSYYQALKDIAADEIKASKSFGKAAGTEIRKIVQPLMVKSFDSDSAMSQIKKLRNEADKAYSGTNPDKVMGKAYKGAANALEDAFENHLSQTGQSDLLAKFRESRKLIAKTHTVESVTNPSTGLIDPQLLGKLAKDNKKLGKLSGKIKDMAEFSHNFPKSTKSPEIAAGHGISKLDAEMAGLSGVGSSVAAGLAGGGPIGAGAALVGGALLPAATSSLARKRIFSKSYQKGQLPKYDVKRNALSRMPELSKEDMARISIMSGNAMSNNEK